VPEGCSSAYLVPHRGDILKREILSFSLLFIAIPSYSRDEGMNARLSPERTDT